MDCRECLDDDHEGALGGRPSHVVIAPLDRRGFVGRATRGSGRALAKSAAPSGAIEVKMIGGLLFLGTLEAVGEVGTPPSPVEAAQGKLTLSHTLLSEVRELVRLARELAAAMGRGPDAWRWSRTACCTPPIV